jgi:hypothetical protein
MGMGLALRIDLPGALARARFLLLLVAVDPVFVDGSHPQWVVFSVRMRG